MLWYIKRDIYENNHNRHTNKRAASRDTNPSVLQVIFKMYSLPTGQERRHQNDTEDVKDDYIRNHMALAEWGNQQRGHLLSCPLAVDGSDTHQKLTGKV